ncbi:uncharacterized protein MKS88_000287 [Plasmodium brasilianum]|uniref:uncharacterized protein n=1 Tax=Plasmodium brasilianum TaxID=5824 RepID=UPI00350E531E|nr:hypothetical protein MKS88_000287 [Plasmodium brasilianum]
MEENFKLLIFTKTFMFMLLTWIFHFNDDLGNFYTYFYKNYSFDGKLCTITYRLLAKHKQGKCSNTKWINEVIPNNGKYKQKDTYNSEKITKRKSIRIDKCSPKCGENYKLPKRNESSMYIRGNLYCKKRIFDKIYYKNIVRNEAIEDFKFLKESIKVKLFGIFILGSFHILVGIALLVLRKLKYLDVIDSVFPISGHSVLSAMLFLILTFVVEAAILYLNKKVLKYIKTLEKKSDIHNTAYPSLHKVVIYKK